GDDHSRHTQYIGAWLWTTLWSSGGELLSGGSHASTVTLQQRKQHKQRGEGSGSRVRSSGQPRASLERCRGRVGGRNARPAATRVDAGDPPHRAARRHRSTGGTE